MRVKIRFFDTVVCGFCIIVNSIYSVEIQWDKEVLNYLADGYNMYYGARSIKHEVERRIVTQLALAHETGQLTSGSTVRLLVDHFR